MRVLSFCFYSYLQLSFYSLLIISTAETQQETTSHQDSLSQLAKPSLKNSKDRMFLCWSFSQIMECSKCYACHVKTSVRHLIDLCTTVDRKMTHTTASVPWYLRVAKTLPFSRVSLQLLNIYQIMSKNDINRPYFPRPRKYRRLFSEPTY